MAHPKDKIRNVILCEDIRDEIGNKKSLMGVMAGDILVGEFPATLSVASYLEYVPDSEDGSEFSAEFRLLKGDSLLISGEIRAPIEPGKIVQLILPRGLAIFDAETSLRMLVSVKGGAEFEVFNKKISVATTS